jgi:hypothetical protein
MAHARKPGRSAKGDIDMRCWKKVVSLLVLASPLGLFAPACMGGAEEPTKDADSAESETAATDAVPGEDTNMTRANVYEYPPCRGCVQWCEEQFQRCDRLHHDNPRWECGWGRYVCTSYCRPDTCRR